ncbi:MAG: efflux RND transporter periplasmic adaptor subunit [Marinomonas hwangdonensis]|nr:efflux RND transporter periplasmic adaptor subunit [Marinomonas hwangdonensis]
MWHKVGIVVVALSWMSQLAAQTTHARGLLVATHKATLSSELAARVVELPKKMGESFKQGDTLVALDCRLFEAQQDKVSAEVKVAQIRLENTKQLNQLRSIGTLEVAIAESELQKIIAEQRIAQLNVERCEIKAPFDGAVEQLDISPFEVVQQQQALLKIVGVNRLDADIIVPAEWLSWLEVGTVVQLTVEETGQSLQGKLSHIGPSIDPTSQTLQLKAEVKIVPEKVLPGMSVVAQFVEK